MEPINANDQKQRQTGILSNEEALAMQQAHAERQQQGKKNGGKKAKAGGFKLASTPNTAVSKPKAATRAGPKPAQYGLHVPLLDAKGHKKTRARSVTTLLQKETKTSLLAIVHKYGGVAKEKEFKDTDASKKVMATWVQNVETRAFGNGTSNEANEAKADKTMKAPAKAAAFKQGTPSTNVAPSGPISLNALGNIPGKRKRQADNNGVLFEQTSKKQNPDYKDGSTLRGSKFATTRDHPGNTSQVSGKDKSRIEDEELEDLLTKGFEDNGEDMKISGLNFKADNKVSMLKKDLKHSPNNRNNNNTNELHVKKVHSKHLLEQHPIIDALGLIADVNAPELGTQVLELPREHVIITTIPSKYGGAPHVVETSIPRRNTRNHRISDPQPSQQIQKPEPAAPFLKPGKHGWDYENHCWSWEGDRDLHTGIGHQVDPEDQERLDREGEAYEKEFKNKYTGYLGNQWPCGCQLPWNDSDSEEE
jgi:hypothetical protein